jgi:hypothetical protein
MDLTICVSKDLFIHSNYVSISFYEYGMHLQCVHKCQWE